MQFPGRVYAHTTVPRVRGKRACRHVLPRVRDESTHMIDGVALPLAVVGGMFVMFVFYVLISAFVGFIRFVTFVVLLPWYVVRAIGDMLR